MLGNNEKIEGVELKDVFTGMLAELPWDSLRAYILSNAVLAKLCTMGGFRLDPKFRSRMEKIVIKDVEKNEFNEASCNGVFASWYPVHTQLHKDLEDYFHSDGYKAYREEKGLGEDVKFYLEFFKYGCPPHGGFGLGIDRLTMLMLGLPIKEAMFLFRGPSHLTP